MLDDDAIVVEEAVRRHVLDRSDATQERQWTALVVRFLAHALRADTQHSGAHEQWRTARPHVLAICAAAERDEVFLGDVVYLLDRLSVYLREGVEDADAATALAERAVALSTALGPQDPELHGHCLGNLALAHHAAGRRRKAERASTLSLEFLAAALGKKSETYAESLNVHGDILRALGRRKAAARAHARALKIVRKLYRDDPDQRELLVQVLNDYAAQLLSTKNAERADKARRLLDEASRLVRRGDGATTDGLRSS